MDYYQNSRSTAEAGHAGSSAPTEERNELSFRQIFLRARLLMLCDGVRRYNQPCSETLHGLVPVRLYTTGPSTHWTMSTHAQHDGLVPGGSCHILACGARKPAQRRVWRPQARAAARPPSTIHTHISPAGNVRPRKVLLLLRPSRPGGAARRGQTRAADRRAGRPRGGSPRDRPAAGHRAAGGRSGRAAGGAARGAWPPPS